MDSEFIGKKKIGQILIEMGVLTDEQLEWALEKQQELNELIGHILIAAGYISEEDLAIALAKQFDKVYVNLEDVELKEDVMDLVPDNLKQMYFLVPLDLSNNILTLALSDPNNFAALDAVQVVTGYDIEFYISTPKQIADVLDLEYQSPSSLEEMAEEEISEGEGEAEPASVDDVLSDINLEFVSEDEDDDEGKQDLLRQQADQKPIILLVNKILVTAIQEKVSDIHIECREKMVLVRCRIDGVLYDKMPIAKKAQDAIVSRIKIMAELNIAERKIPQDGAFTIKLGGKTVDFRISILPSIWGENIVMRILDKGNLQLDLKVLGFSETDYDKFNRAIHKPYGMVLVTGPTGSGKTTTLYSALSVLNDPETKLITVEDPVEYQLDGIHQVQVHINKNDPTRSLTFAAGLRSILRQDPDVIMIGEIRDGETAEIAVKSALTGHLVYSTVHANNAIDVVGRMGQMGIDTYLLAASLNLVVAQRLVRKLCEKCKEPYHPTEDDFSWLEVPWEKYKDETFFRSKGCDQCRNTGYAGRCAVYELLEVDEELKAMVAGNASLYEMKKRAVEKGMDSLQMSAFKKVMLGISTLDEVLRVTM